MIYHISIFLLSFFVLAFAAQWLVNSLTFLARFFKWREFVLVYFILVTASSIPNLSVGIFSVINNVPELYFGDILGNILITLTFIVGVSAIVSKGLRADSRVVQKSSYFLLASAFLPLFLIIDGELSRGDGFALLLMFFVYSAWLFSKRKLFEHEYEEKEKIKHPYLLLVKSLSGVILGIPFLILSGYFIVKTSIYFIEYFNFETALFGMFIVAIGTSLPELFFIITAAKKQNDWLALGGIIGNVIALSTFGLGFLTILSPVKIVSFSYFSTIFIFLIISTLLFFLFIKSGKKITPIEGLILFSLYIFFISSKIIF